MPDENANEGTHAREVGVESEIGGTAGTTHDELLVRTLGRERGMDVAARDGPPPVRKK